MHTIRKTLVVSLSVLAVSAAAGGAAWASGGGAAAGGRTPATAPAQGQAPATVRPPEESELDQEEWYTSPGDAGWDPEIRGGREQGFPVESELDQEEWYTSPGDAGWDPEIRGAAQGLQD